jgi:Tfp pilus assembly protein PilO
LIAAGFYMPGSPVASVRTELEAAQQEEKPLEADVASLRVYKQRRAELQSEMDALSKQLATLQTIVPEDKKVDEFILMVQSAAASSGVSIRHLKALPVAPKQFYFEVPFEIDCDGPYFAVLDFFAKLGRLSRIINVGDMKLTSAASKAGTTYRMTPGTSVAGVLTVTTFFSKPADASAPSTATPASAKR